jgi:hypothetical protein
MPKLNVVDTDNRDSRTTWLLLEDGNFVEVDPYELLLNVVENIFDESPKLNPAMKLMAQIKEVLG